MDEHEFVGVKKVNHSRADWECSCGITGFATMAFRDEKIEQKAKNNWRQHARYAAKKDRAEKETVAI